MACQRVGAGQAGRNPVPWKSRFPDPLQLLTSAPLPARFVKRMAIQQTNVFIAIQLQNQPTTLIQTMVIKQICVYKFIQLISLKTHPILQLLTGCLTYTGLDATAHMTNDLSALQNPTPYTGLGSVLVVNGDHLPIAMIGTSALHTDTAIFTPRGFVCTNTLQKSHLCWQVCS